MEKWGHQTLSENLSMRMPLKKALAHAFICQTIWKQKLHLTAISSYLRWLRASKSIDTSFDCLETYVSALWSATVNKLLQCARGLISHKSLK